MNTKIKILVIVSNYIFQMRFFEFHNFDLTFVFNELKVGSDLKIQMHYIEIRISNFRILTYI